MNQEQLNDVHTFAHTVSGIAASRMDGDNIVADDVDPQEHKKKRSIGLCRLSIVHRYMSVFTKSFGLSYHDYLQIGPPT